MNKRPAATGGRAPLNGQGPRGTSQRARARTDAPAGRETEDAAPRTGRGSRWHVLNWPLRSRMLLLVLVPLLAIVPLAGVRVVSEYQGIQSASDIHDQSMIAQRSSDLVNALGDERDRTEVALAGKGVQGDAELAAAQKRTTAKVRAYSEVLRQYEGSVSALPPETRQLGDRARARLGDLAPLRDSARRLGTGTPTFTAYSTVIDYLLDFNNQLSASTSDHELGTLVSTHGSVDELEEQTSIQRGYLVQILSSGHATLAQTEDLQQARAQFTSAYNSLTNNAPTPVLNLYQSRVSGNTVGAADGAVQSVTAAAQEGTSISRLGTSSGTAYRNMTVKLRQIRSVQHDVNGQVSDRAEELLSEKRLDLYLNVGIILVVVLLSFFGAIVLARSVVRPLRKLQSSALDVADSRLPEVVRKLREARSPDEVARSQPIAVDSLDEVGQVARAFDRVHFEAVRLATEQAMMRENVNTMFTNLSRRSESLVLRQLNLIDELEEGEQSAARLDSLFKLDHLATRMRRNNESLLVLAGEEQGRRWNRPVLLLDVARAAGAEVEQYERVALRELPDVAVAGQAATDVVHLVAELIENAISFSAPETEVVVSGGTQADGVRLEITDSGIGMGPAELEEVNRKLAEPPVIDVSISRRMGLFVVGRLAGKHGIRVWLTKASSVGVSANVVIPRSMLRSTSELDSDSSTAFDQAMRVGGQDELDISNILNSGFPSAEPAGVPEFSREPFNEKAFDSLSRAEEAPVSGGFTWFTDETGPGHDQPAGGQQPAVAHDFDWFAETAEEPPPVQPAAYHGGPAPGLQQLPPPQPYAGQPRIAAAPERLPIFDSIESEWFGSEEHRSPAPAQPEDAWPARPANGVSSHAPQRTNAALNGPAHAAGPVRSASARAAEPVTGGQTPQGLPRRVPRSNLMPGYVPSNDSPPVEQTAVSARSAEDMKERLARFHQGVRNGKGALDGGENGPWTNGSDGR